MNRRRICLIVLGAAVLPTLGCPGSVGKEATGSAEKNRPDGVIGYYVHDDLEFYQAKSMKDVPPGRIMYLGIEEGRWLMHNMLTAYGGTWEMDQHVATMTVKVGPTGKADGKEKTFTRRTATGITMSPSKDRGPYMKLTYIGPTAPANFGWDEALGEKK